MLHFGFVQTTCIFLCKKELKEGIIMPRNQFQRMVFAFLTVVITVHAYVFYSLYVVNGSTLMEINNASGVIEAINNQGGVYMFGKMLPIWAIILVEFACAYVLEVIMGSPLSFKLASKIGVFNELGEMIASWTNTDYAPGNNGYNSIIAQPQADGSVLIHTYASSNSYGAAAVLKFTPESSEDMAGSENNPLHVSTADDLMGLASKCFDGTTYVVLDNDIDLTGVQYKVPFSEQAATNKIVHFDGQHHVIKNLKGAVTVTGEGEEQVTTVVVQNASLFGAFRGSIKNLGVENIDVNVTWFCTGSLVGVSVGDLTIDNCYATGSAQGAASGGLVGSCNSGKLTITNCYSQVNTADNAGGHSAGLVGRTNSDVSISYAYASGSVYSKKTAAALINVNSDNAVVTLDNVIAWNSSVKGEELASMTVCGNANLSNVTFFGGMLLNDEPAAGGKTAADLQQTATAWQAFSKDLVNGYPILAWQSGTSGISEIEAEETDAPAEYYNLQGIKVANPENGIFIVRRGNKVTKEIIR